MEAVLASQEDIVFVYDDAIEGLSCLESVYKILELDRKGRFGRNENERCGQVSLLGFLYIVTEAEGLVACIKVFMERDYWYDNDYSIFRDIEGEKQE